ncbi:MAG: DUF3179 domain-containing protein [Bacteroidota bacterium]
MKKECLIIISSFFLLSTACQRDEVDIGTNSDWLIPQNEIRDGGPGKDGIPSIDNPDFITVSEVDFLQDDDLVIAVKYGEEIRGYAHVILDWHEIVNDQKDDLALSINYCPLTGTAIGWNRMIAGRMTEFGVSGLLYNTNLIPYDRATDSNWSQMRLECVEGELQGTKAELHPVVETTWKTIKERYPETRILSLNTGFNRSYGRYPYGDYKTSSSLLFPVSNTDNTIFAKERVLGVIVEDATTVYQYFHFSDAKTVLQDQVGDQEIVIFGSQTANYLVAYQAQTEGGDSLSFESVVDSDEAVAIDNEGNEWNLFGEAISGERKGQRLKTTRSYIGYFFSWAAFYPELEIF